MITTSNDMTCLPTREIDDRHESTEEEQNDAMPRRLPLTKGNQTQDFAQGVLSTKGTPDVSLFVPLLLQIH